MVEEGRSDYEKWYNWAYEQRYGKGRIGTERGESKAVAYEPEIKKYWDENEAFGAMEFQGKFIGIACLAAKEVADKESFVRRFGLSFEKDVQWRAVSGLLDHLSRSPAFKAVLVTTSKIPFKMEADIPEDLEGKRNWTERNYEYHKGKAEALKANIEQQEKQGVLGGPFPIFLPKQMKEEQDHARYYLEASKGLEQHMREHLKNFFTIKENLFAAALFFYVYTDAKESLDDALKEIEARKYSAKMEMLKTYFVECSDVREPLLVFNPEIFLLPMK